jgi:hypothetical protein
MSRGMPGPSGYGQDASSSCPSREDAAAGMVGRSTNRRSEITPDLKRPSLCGITRAVRLPRRRRAGAGALLLER